MTDRIQYKNWRVCQICGDVIRSTDAEEAGWLASPGRYDPSVVIVRCPLHISEWSLRISLAGRTIEWRKKIAEIPNLPRPIPPMLSPFPMSDEDPTWNPEDEGRKKK